MKPETQNSEPGTFDLLCGWLAMFFVVLLSFVLLLGERLKQRFFGRWRQRASGVAPEDQTDNGSAAGTDGSTFFGRWRRPGGKLPRPNGEDHPSSVATLRRVDETRAAAAPVLTGANKGNEAKESHVQLD